MKISKLLREFEAENIFNGAGPVPQAVWDEVTEIEEHFNAIHNRDTVSPVRV